MCLCMCASLWGTIEITPFYHNDWKYDTFRFRIMPRMVMAWWFQGNAGWLSLCSTHLIISLTISKRIPVMYGHNCSHLLKLSSSWTIALGACEYSKVCSCPVIVTQYYHYSCCQLMSQFTLYIEIRWIGPVRLCSLRALTKTHTEYIYLFTMVRPLFV